MCGFESHSRYHASILAGASGPTVSRMATGRAGRLARKRMKTIIQITFTMKKLLLFFATAMVLCSCSSKLGELSADYFTVTPNPLETKGGKVPVTIDGTIPEKFMKKKATVTVTPELRYGGEVAQGQSAAFQGEKASGNGQTVPYNEGGTYTMRAQWTYAPAMHVSDLYLTFDAAVGSKTVSIPDVKIADGIIATSELYKCALGSSACMAADAYQRIIDEQYVAQVKFLINQATLRKSELETTSVEDFVKLLKDINDNQEGLALTNIEVLAYASPDGAYDFNDKLASQREKVSEDYVNTQMKDAGVSSDVTAKYTAEDWEGFQELVAASDIQDKDVILRVLSMYQDPDEREQQIRNMSAGYQELADGILPELRRARMIANYQVIGRSDEQILEQYEADPSVLSLEELLYAATLVSDIDTKEAIYKAAISAYPDDYRAYNNVGAIEIAKGNIDEADSYISKALSIDGSAAEANGNKGLIAMYSGKLDEAEAYIAKAGEAADYKKALGTLKIAQGDFAGAEDTLSGTNCNMEALAQILNKDYSGAASTLGNITERDAMTDYFEAILNARQGNDSGATSHKKDAVDKDASLSTYAEEDLEFRNVGK